jgi:hypothetical protein
MAAINGFTMAAGQAQIKAPIDSSELYTHAEKVMSFPVDGINGNVPRRRGANKFAAGY